MQKDNDHLYLQVAKEIQRGFRDEALWTKAFALESGDEKRTQAHYIRLRVAALEATGEPKSTEIPQRAKVTQPTKKAWNKWLIIPPIVLLAIGGWLQAKTKSVSLKPIAPTEIPSTSQPTEIELGANGIQLDKVNHNVWIKGEIKQGTAKILKTVLSDETSFRNGDPFVVFLDSNGGDLYAAMDIGRTIRGKGNSVVAVLENAKCYSSCVFILAGGGQRIRQGSIGIHRPYLNKPIGNEQQLAAWFAKISNDAKSYLQEMRVRESLFDDMVNIAPSEIHIFESTAEMDKYGLISLDPVVEEKIAAATMKRLGISRQDFLYREKAAKQVCTDDFTLDGKNYTSAECYNKFMSGEFALQPN